MYQKLTVKVVLTNCTKTVEVVQLHSDTIRHGKYGANQPVHQCQPEVGHKRTNHREEVNMEEGKKFVSHHGSQRDQKAGSEEKDYQAEVSIEENKQLVPDGTRCHKIRHGRWLDTHQNEVEQIPLLCVPDCAGIT